jgi:hypothetical protein
VKDNAIAQAARAVAGSNLEAVVACILNALLNEQNIFILKGSEKELRRVLQDDGLARQIMDYSRLPVKRPCNQTQIEDYPDTDLFVLYKDEHQWRVLGIISCKVSFHARHTEVAFWGLAIRISSNMRYVCVTEDANVWSGSRSELGVSCEQSTAARRILECYTHRVYLVKKYTSTKDPILESDIGAFCARLKTSTAEQRQAKPCFDDLSSANHTRYCPHVCPLDELYFDILRWRAEVLPEH